MVQRGRQVDGATPIFDTLLSLAASSQDPASGGRHKVWGSRALWVPPQTSTIASHLPKAVGAAFALERGLALDLDMPVPDDSIVVATFGDASANHSTAQGAINAAIWGSYQHLPMVRMTNTFVLNGPDTPEDIISSTPNGVYVAKLGGGSVNTATGDFVFGMTEAYLIEDGKITEPLREGNLIGNGPKVLRDIDMLATDFAMGNPGTCGKDGQGVPVGDGQPTLRVKELTIGGTAA